MGVGEQVVVDRTGFTGVAGVWAAGNVSEVLAGVPQAAAAGVAAAAAVNMDLLMVDARSAAESRGAGVDVFSGSMEAEVSRRVLGPGCTGWMSSTATAETRLLIAIPVRFGDAVRVIPAAAADPRMIKGYRTRRPCSNCAPAVCRSGKDLCRFVIGSDTRRGRAIDYTERPATRRTTSGRRILGCPISQP